MSNSDVPRKYSPEGPASTPGIRLLANHKIAAVGTTTAILWFARSLIPGVDAGPSGEYFRGTSLFDIAWQLTVYALITTWVTVVVTSVLGCLFIRYTAASPGLYPSRGLSGALLMYRMHMMNR